MELQCNGRFCPVGDDDTSATTLTLVKKKVNSADKKELEIVDPTDSNDSYQIVRPIDPNNIDRNRQLRKQRNEQRMKEQADIRNKYQNKNPVGGPADIIKLKLQVTLKKYQGLQIDYSMVSDYFDNSFKAIEKTGNWDLDTLRDILVFDKATLTDSSACYARALLGVQKVRSITLQSIADIIEGLVETIKSFD